MQGIDRKQQLKARIDEIKKDLGNSKLLLVSKNTDIKDIKLAYELGERNFGENRIIDLSEKANLLKNDCPDISWHMIGKIQTNKLNQLLKVPNLKTIHSIDSLKLLEKLHAKKESIQAPILLYLQVNTSLETEKSGFQNLDELINILNNYGSKPNLKIEGLMTIGKIRSDDFNQDALICFDKLYDFKEKLNDQFNLSLKLSMGMSQDYQLAVEKGTSWVRIGSNIFKP